MDYSKGIVRAAYHIRDENMSMNDPWKSASIDVPFAVPFVQRLRFTRDVLGADRHVLAELLEPAEGQVSRVQFWLDANVAAAHPELPGKIHGFAAEFATGSS